MRAKTFVKWREQAKQHTSPKNKNNNDGEAKKNVEKKGISMADMEFIERSRFIVLDGVVVVVGIRFFVVG